MKKKSDCGCSCKMAEAFKDIYTRLEKLEQYNNLREPMKKPRLDVDVTTASGKGYHFESIFEDEFICQDCGKKGKGMGEFSYSTGYCDECYEARHSTYFHLNPLNPQRRIGRKK